MEKVNNIVSMYEITKIMFEGKSDFEKQLEFEKWIKEKNQKMKKFGSLKEEQNQMRKNYIDLPLSIDKTYEGKIVKRAEIGEEGYAENIEYQLMVAVDPNNGKMSVQYYGEDDTYLSHKEIIKAIKIENNIGKYGKE